MIYASLTVGAICNGESWTGSWSMLSLRTNESSKISCGAARDSVWLPSYLYFLVVFSVVFHLGIICPVKTLAISNCYSPHHHNPHQKPPLELKLSREPAHAIQTARAGQPCSVSRRQPSLNEQMSAGSFHGFYWLRPTPKKSGGFECHSEATIINAPN